jgi:hypothetical protein
MGNAMLLVIVGGMRDMFSIGEANGIGYRRD